MKLHLLFLSCLLALAACDKSPTPELTKKQVTSLVDGAPKVFVDDGDRVTLEGLEDFHLGQSEKDAMQAIKKRCRHPVVLQGGWMRGYTFFKGCPTPDDPVVQSFRIGFHPDIDNRVFTVELERRNVTPDVLRARFYDRFGTPTEELVRPGIVEDSTARLHVFADWDDGLKGPTHVIVGYRPEIVEEMQKKAKKEKKVHE